MDDSNITHVNSTFQSITPTQPRPENPINIVEPDISEDITQIGSIFHKLGIKHDYSAILKKNEINLEKFLQMDNVSYWIPLGVHLGDTLIIVQYILQMKGTFSFN